MLTEKKIIDIAINYAGINKSEYFSLKFFLAQPSKFLDGYWDVSFKVLNEEGNEIEGPLLIAIDGETGNVYTMEELIMKQKGNSGIKISSEPIKK